MIIQSKHAGITPAYAGKSWRRAMASSCRKDHPRIRGEKTLNPQPGMTRGGSPPHTRGKASGPERYESRTGITPAYAGKREGNRGDGAIRWDHPRIRGEKQHGNTHSPQVPGSPPHTRGKGGGMHGDQTMRGITPAYAGKRTQAPLSRTQTWDHPRIRGEKRFY